MIYHSSSNSSTGGYFRHDAESGVPPPPRAQNDGSDSQERRTCIYTSLSVGDLWPQIRVGLPLVVRGHNIHHNGHGNRSKRDEYRHQSNNLTLILQFRWKLCSSNNARLQKKVHTQFIFIVCCCCTLFLGYYYRL